MKKQRIFIILLIVGLSGAVLYLFFSKNKIVPSQVEPTAAPEVVDYVTSTNFISSTPKSTSTPIVQPTKKSVQKPNPNSETTTIPKPTPTTSAPAPTPTPAPIPVETNFSISANGVLFFTNKARQENGELPALQSNSVLNSIAIKRVGNMFKYQYFSHNSPDSMDMINLAKSEGYIYGALGENIIMGDFDSSVEVVNTWMNSAGHRANILGTQYSEIGIAIKKGLYGGREQWIGVQIFGRQLN